MRRALSTSILCYSLLLVGFAFAQERIDLTSPETKPSNSQYRIARLTQDFDKPSTPADEGQIHLQLEGQNGEALSCVYNAQTSPTATFLNNALNKADLSSAYAGNATTGSFKHRVCHRLVVMGESTARCGVTIVGTCTGSVP